MKTNRLASLEFSQTLNEEDEGCGGQLGARVGGVRVPSYRPRDRGAPRGGARAGHERGRLRRADRTAGDGAAAGFLCRATLRPQGAQVQERQAPHGLRVRLGCVCC
jgi:hypothetical protein